AAEAADGGDHAAGQERTDHAGDEGDGPCPPLVAGEQGQLGRMPPDAVVGRRGGPKDGGLVLEPVVELHEVSLTSTRSALTAPPSPAIGEPATGPPSLAIVKIAPPDVGNDWLALTDDELPVEGAVAWAGLPSCGAVVLFSGTVRDHAEGRPGVSSLQYEAYEEEVVPRLAAIAAEARARWPVLGRVVLL